MAKGQPEEILMRHQLKIMPRMPQRGRECQCRQPGSPMSWFETRTHLCSSGSASIRSISCLLCSSARPDSSRRPLTSASLAASASRTRSSSSTERIRGPPPGAGTPNSIPVRGKAEPKSPPSSASIAAI